MSGGGSKVWQDGQRYCPKCTQYQSPTCYGKCTQNRDGLNRYCRPCESIRGKVKYYKASPEVRQKKAAEKWVRNKPTYLEYCAKNKGRLNAKKASRKAHIKRATPPWADKKAISEFYQNCPPGYQVDHIIPLRGKTVSGLHILENLQYLTAQENLSKGNRMKEGY